MSDIIPVFSSHYSFAPILTLEEAGKTEVGNAVSICDIAKANNLKQVYLSDDRIDGYIEAFKNIQKTGVAELVYGIRFVVVPDMLNKTQESARQESRVTIFLNNTQGYNDVLRLWSRAWNEGIFSTRDGSYGRLDWKTLKEYWTPNLNLALPFFSSFLARNTLRFANIIPDLPVPANEVILLKEVESELAFTDLIEDAVNRFAADTGAQIKLTKSIYYATKADFDAYVVYRAILGHGDFSSPGVPHMSSDTFCFEEWLRLTKEST